MESQRWDCIWHVQGYGPVVRVGSRLYPYSTVGLLVARILSEAVD